MNKILLGCTAILSTFTSITAQDKVIAESELTSAYTSKSYARQSVHDPSIVIDTITSKTQTTYYVFGSHVAGAKSSNLYNWSWQGAGENNTAVNSWFGKLSNGTTGTVSRCAYTEAYKTNVITKVKNCNGEEVTFGNFDAGQWQYSGYSIRGNQWAPDVIYNYKTNKWLMYMSVNGDKWTSAIVCLASDNVDGPYVYQGPVVFSGFQNTYAHNGFAASNDWKHTDLEIALGPQTSLPARYNVGGSWGSYWPNCIDPCVFYDDNGNLKMSYGSWSGGIFMLDLDEETGLRDYTVKYNYRVNNAATTSTSANQNCTEDPYFGKKIAGGWYNSGEASYIEKIGKYYFLFMSNGGLEAKGGYQMRVFRSKYPDGPFVDCQGNEALYKSAQLNYGNNSRSNSGVLLMCNYKWDTMNYAEVAQGHNSAATDQLGRTMVVYHTRQNTGNEGHSVRTHQLFLNEDGWLVSSPYEINFEDVQTQNTIETVEQYKTEDIVGDWQMLRHTYCQNTAALAYQSPINVHLNADGTATSSSSTFTGTWKVKAGTSYITVTLDGVAYKGVLTKQVIDYTNIPALCIAALSSSSGTYNNQASCTKGVMLWGSKAETKGALKYNLTKLDPQVTNGMTTQTDLILPIAGQLGASISWSSSDENVIKSDGTLVGNGTTTMTMTISKDGYCVKKDFKVTASTSGETVTYYPECGSTDRTTGFFTKYSDMYTINKGEEINLRFYNYGTETQNYYNWILAASNVSHGTTGYKEYFVLRADRWGWGDYCAEPPINMTMTYNDELEKNNDLNWDLFKTEMYGALVDMRITYNGKAVRVKTQTTTKSGYTINYSFISKSGITANSIVVFLSVDHSYILPAPSSTPNNMIEMPDENDNTSIDNNYYDLNGRIIKEPKHGLYIYKGKLIKK